MSVALAIQSIKAATDIAKGIVALSKDVAVNTKATELLAIINNLHQQISELQAKYEAVSSSEKEWKQKALHREKWEETKRGYSRHKLAPGVTVYVSNADSSPIEEHEWYCVNCMDIEEKESILQHHKDLLTGTDFICPACKNHILKPRSSEEHLYA